MWTKGRGAGHVLVARGRVNKCCQEIQFAGNDVLDGDVHFNDSPLMGSAGDRAAPQTSDG